MKPSGANLEGFRPYQMFVTKGVFGMVFALAQKISGLM